jgi:hypothetical protein
LRSYLTTTSLEELREDLGRFRFVFLHSGAYTLQQSKKGFDKTLLQGYAKEYFKTILDIHELFAGISDLDVDTFEYEKPSEFPSNFVPIISGRPLKEYEDLGWFDNYEYIAVNSETIKNTRYMKELFKLGTSKNVLFHGLGVGSQSVISGIPFYSIDATSWIHGGKFGKTTVFQNGKLFHYDKDNKDERRRFKNKFIQAGLNWAEIDNDNPLEINLMNAFAWTELEEYYQYNVKHNYWITEEEHKDILEHNKKTLTVPETAITVSETALSTHVSPSLHEKLQCNTCAINGACPKFTQDSECSYNFEINLVKPEDFQRAFKSILELEYMRIARASLFETHDGGSLDKKLSGEMANFFQMVKDMKEIMSAPKEKITITAEGGGAVTTMLNEIFGAKEDKKSVPIDITPKKD